MRSSETGGWGDGSGSLCGIPPSCATMIPPARWTPPLLSSGGWRLNLSVEVSMREEQDSGAEPRWKHDGVRVIKGNQLDDSTPQTPGMYRQAAINHARVGAQKIW